MPQYPSSVRCTPCLGQAPSQLSYQQRPGQVQASGHQQPAAQGRERQRPPKGQSRVRFGHTAKLGRKRLQIGTAEAAEQMVMLRQISELQRAIEAEKRSRRNN